MRPGIFSGRGGRVTLESQCRIRAKSIRKVVFLTTGVFLSESDPDRLVLIWSLGFKFRTSHASPRINSQGDRSELAQDACSSVGRVKGSGTGTRLRAGVLRACL